jgi:hypothetical protein
MKKMKAASAQKSSKPVAASGMKASASSGAAREPRGRKNPEAMLARVEAVRLAQRQEGNFDCFATAKSGFCDQGDCLYHSDCLSISARV